MAETKKTFCPVDRYSITDLATKIADSYNKETDPEEVLGILENQVNFKDEKVSSEHLELFVADLKNEPEWKQYKYVKENTISAQEAYLFIRKMRLDGKLDGNTLDAKVARYMNDVFFEGRIFGEIHTPYPVTINYYHDADTPTVLVTQEPECNTEASTVSVRTGGIDGSEVGNYDEVLADRSRLKREKEKNSPYPYNRADIKEASDGGWTNDKLVENVDKLHLELSKDKWDPATISYADRAALNKIIAASIDYSGQLPTIVMNDKLSWNRDKSEIGAALAYDLQICWTSDDYPMTLCGSWQPYDLFGRNLVDFLQPDKLDTKRKAFKFLSTPILPELVSWYMFPTNNMRYTRERLPVIMRTEGKKLYGNFKSTVNPLVAQLEKSGNAEVAKAAREIVSGISDPTESYSEGHCHGMYHSLVSLALKFGFPVLNDDQVFQINNALVFSYEKYANQQRKVFSSARDTAMANKVGQWSDKPFMMLWDINSRSSRYSTEDCREKIQGMNTSPYPYEKQNLSTTDNPDGSSNNVDGMRAN